MKIPDALFWENLAASYPKDMVEKLRKRFERGEAFELSPDELVSETDHAVGVGVEILEALATEGFLSKRERYSCGCDSQKPLTVEQVKSGVCPFCNCAFKDIGEVDRTVLYFKEGQQTRDVQWVLALHGMNTRGAWQEDFDWMISRTYGRSVPVAIYKYGIVRPGAVIAWRQRALTRQLIARIKRLSGEAAGAGFGGVPDVIAHSFGTWLLGHALQIDGSLRVGRVILTGCILRPDFNWAKLIEHNQVEAVLCHYATDDFWAAIAHYIVPDSGPSGRRGFNDRKALVHVVAEGLKHSDFFLSGQMPKLHTTVWQPFLTRSSDQLEKLAKDPNPPANWRQSFWLLRARLLRWAILLLVLGICVFLTLALAVGIWSVIDFFR